MRGLQALSREATARSFQHQLDLGTRKQLQAALQASPGPRRSARRGRRARGRTAHDSGDNGVGRAHLAEALNAERRRLLAQPWSTESGTAPWASAAGSRSRPAPGGTTPCRWAVRCRGAGRLCHHHRFAAPRCRTLTRTRPCSRSGSCALRALAAGVEAGFTRPSSLPAGPPAPPAGTYTAGPHQRLIHHAIASEPTSSAGQPVAGPHQAMSPVRTRLSASSTIRCTLGPK